jgi:beta-galactosidase beta subunit
VAVPAGTFAIFFPEDGHAPLAGAKGLGVKKLVVKVAVEGN